MRQTVRLLAALSAFVAAGIVAAAAAAATAPSNTSPPTISGRTFEGQTLTASTGQWSGTTPLTFSYQWQSCNENGGSCTAVAGATTDSLKLSSDDIGNTFRVKVTATNSAGSASETSVPTAVVTAQPVGAVRLTASRHSVLFGRSVVLSGTVENGANQMVRIEGDGFPFQPAQFTQVAQVQTDANGNFSVTLAPQVNTAYFAVSGGEHSNSLVVNVRPRVLVQHAGLHHFVIKALADTSLAGKIVLVQRWSPSKHLWISVQRLTLHGGFAQGSGVVSTTSITLGRFGGTTTRIFLPPRSAKPGYLSSTSSAFTA